MSSAIRHDDLRKRNRAMAISVVRRTALPSRTDIAARTGLSHSTLSAIAADLIEEGVLLEIRNTDQSAPKRGRPQVALRLNPDAAAIVTVVLTLNLLSVAVIDYAGGVVVEEQRKLATLTMPEDEMLDECIALARRCMEKSGFEPGRIVHVVVAVQGTTDAARRTMLWSPITPHTDIDFAGRLEKALALPVTVENDCNMIAVSLRWRDPERYRDDFIAILLSHGIGMGLVLKGELFTGTHSSGGEFGHMVHRPDGALCRCGRRGCVEAYAGNYAIWRSARNGGEDELPADDIGLVEIEALAAQARQGEGPARDAFRKAGEALGFGLGSLFALIDPAPVAMVGIGAAAFDVIEPHLRGALARTAGGQHNKAISFATETNEAPLIRQGCAMWALTFIDEALFAARAADPAGEG